MTTRNPSQKRLLLWGFLAAVIIAFFLSPWASSRPDGLERVAEKLGFIKKAGQSGVTWWDRSPFPDYKIPGIPNEGWATALSGLLGTLAMVLLGWGLCRLLRRKRE